MKKTTNLSGWGYRLTAISLIIVSLLLAGCATKQDVMHVDEKVNQVRNDQRVMRSQMEHLDTLLNTQADKNDQLRLEVRAFLEDIASRMSQLQEQVTDLQTAMFQASRGAGMAASQTTQAEQQTNQTQAQTPADSAATAASDTVTTITAPPIDCQRLWDNAFKDMRRGQYDLAISGFTDYLKFCPRTEFSDNSQYWIAEAYYEMQQYERAIEEYNRLLTEYPDSEKKTTVYFKLGRSYEELGNQSKALEYYLILQNEYPGTLEYEQVRDKIAAWQKEKGN